MPDSGESGYIFQTYEDRVYVYRIKDFYYTYMFEISKTCPKSLKPLYIVEIIKKRRDSKISAL